MRPWVISASLDPSVGPGESRPTPARWGRSLTSLCLSVSTFQGCCKNDVRFYAWWDSHSPLYNQTFSKLLLPHSRKRKMKLPRAPVQTRTSRGRPRAADPPVQLWPSRLPTRPPGLGVKEAIDVASRPENTVSELGSRILLCIWCRGILQKTQGGAAHPSHPLAWRSSTLTECTRATRPFLS